MLRSLKKSLGLLLDDIGTFKDTDQLWFSLCMGLLVLYLLQVASAVNTRRRLNKQRQLLARLTGENAELKMKFLITEQEHRETVRRLKHEQNIVLKKVQQLEGVIQGL